MDIYALVVYVHVASILLFFILHGVSMAVAFTLRRERDPKRIAALLDLSAWALGLPAIVTVSVGFFAGIVAGVMGGWWTAAWFWASLVIFVVVAVAMTPMAASRLRAVRTAVGAPTRTATGAAVVDPAGEPASDPSELGRLLDAWNPVPIAVIGLGAFLVILWLMMFKPF